MAFLMHRFLSMQEFYDIDEIFLHDPTAMTAVLRPELFQWRRGARRGPAVWWP
jgi:hypothetical protein